MADDALLKAVQNRNLAQVNKLAEINVRRPITVVVCCGVRYRACDYRHVIASLANLPE
jgi:hypothetical protein